MPTMVVIIIGKYKYKSKERIVFKTRFNIKLYNLPIPFPISFNLTIPKLPDLPPIPPFDIPDITDFNLTLKKLTMKLIEELLKKIPILNLPIPFPISFNLTIPKLPDLPPIPPFDLPTILIGLYTNFDTSTSTSTEIAG